MKLIVGLGNPGKEYAHTRHNTGWLALDYLAAKKSWQENKKAKATSLRLELNGEQLELLKPVTFMNNSGATVSYAIKKYNLKLEDVVVIYDDADLPVGKIRIGYFKSSGGHNGIKSIIEAIGSTGFLRLRIGIKPAALAGGQKIPAEKLVLSRFTAEEKKIITKAIKLAAEAVAEIVREPLSKVLNKFN